MYRRRKGQWDLEISPWVGVKKFNGEKDQKPVEVSGQGSRDKETNLNRVVLLRTVQIDGESRKARR